MNIALNVVTIILGILVTVFIMLQGKGAGLGSAWGGAGEHFQTRRGVEKYLFNLTILAVTVFLLISIANILN